MSLVNGGAPEVTWRRDGRVIVATIDRVKQRNALTRSVVEALADHLSDQSDPVPVVLTGAGDSFCAGVDMSMTPDEREGFRTYNERMLQAIAAWPHIVVAAINGPAVGAGVMLALCCDLRVAGPRARLVLPQTRLGLLLDQRRVDYLVAHLGIGRATDMLLTCAPAEAREAVESGLIHRAADDALAASVLLAEEMVDWQPSVAAHKKMLKAAAASHGT